MIWESKEFFKNQVELVLALKLCKIWISKKTCNDLKEDIRQNGSSHRFLLGKE